MIPQFIVYIRNIMADTSPDSILKIKVKVISNDIVDIF